MRIHFIKINSVEGICMSIDWKTVQRHNRKMWDKFIYLLLNIIFITIM